MATQDQADPHIVDGLVLARAFFKIADAADGRKVIELAAALARSASPPIALGDATKSRRRVEIGDGWAWYVARFNCRRIG